MKKSAKNCLIGLTFLMIAGACSKFEYSPYQVDSAGSKDEELNKKSIEQLLSKEEISDDTVTILFSGDSQRRYDGFRNLLTKVKAMPKIDFMILAGDIADFGILQEYLWINRELDKVNIPVMCAIGNHDLIANGGEIYDRIYGTRNYSFIYKGYKFIFHDTNGREYGFNGSAPNLHWLENEMNDTVPKWFVGVSHVPPYDADFDRTLEFPYKNLFASEPDFLISLHGHIHGTSDTYYYNDHVRYMTSNSVDKPEAVLLKLINGVIVKEIISLQ